MKKISEKQLINSINYYIDETFLILEFGLLQFNINQVNNNIKIYHFYIDFYF